MRESSRGHFGKRGLVAHGRLLRWNKCDRSKTKRACCAVLEGDMTQYSKATCET